MAHLQFASAYLPSDHPFQNLCLPTKQHHHRSNSTTTTLPSHQHGVANRHIDPNLRQRVRSKARPSGWYATNCLTVNHGVYSHHYDHLDAALSVAPLVVADL